MIGNQQTFAGLHRTECWDDENPCCDWPDSHNKNNLIEYDKENEMLQVRLDSYVWDRKDDTLTFDWSLFDSEAEDFCYERGLKKLHKIFDLIFSPPTSLLYVNACLLYTTVRLPTC